MTHTCPPDPLHVRVTWYVRNYTAWTSDVPGCLATGATLPDVEDTYRFALGKYLNSTVLPQLVFTVDGDIPLAQDIPSPDPL
jgi:hypothetical protein